MKPVLSCVNGDCEATSFESELVEWGRGVIIKNGRARRPMNLLVCRQCADALEEWNL